MNEFDIAKVALAIQQALAAKGTVLLPVEAVTAANAAVEAVSEWLQEPSEES